MRIINVLLDLVFFLFFFCYDWAGLCKVEREERKEKKEKSTMKYHSEFWNSKKIVLKKSTARHSEVPTVAFVALQKKITTVMKLLKNEARLPTQYSIP